MPTPGDIERLGPAVVRIGCRPDGSEPLVREDVARSVLPAVMRWLGPYADAEMSDPDRLLPFLMDILKDQDGGDPADALSRRFHMSPDAELLDLLETIPARLNDAKFRLVEVWVREFGLKPGFDLNDAVVISVRVEGELREVKGMVVKINHTYGRCTVHCPSLGHAADAVSGPHGFTVDWDRVTVPA